MALSSLYIGALNEETFFCTRIDIKKYTNLYTDIHIHRTRYNIIHKLIHQHIVTRKRKFISIVFEAEK